MKLIKPAIKYGKFLHLTQRRSGVPAAKEFPERAREFDREETFDLGLWKKACDLGFVGVFIDKQHGGLGYGFLEHCLINEEFWAVEPGIGSAILSTTFGAELIQMFGSDHQQKTILPKLA